ncbi:hypothetical protein [Kitasatospora sp. NPDC059571]|uniref:hypothetical protein n=1 Tax=Kitasatospora sp. NPDC059571 TaxID=3346871 RepID=UPI0036AC1231
MSALTGRSAAAAAAGGIMAFVCVCAGPAYADGASSPFKGRTDSGNLIVRSGDVIVCFAENQVVVADTEGKFRQTDGPGTSFTTPAGAAFRTLDTGKTFPLLQNGGVEVSFEGASAVVTCPKSLVPATSAFVPKSTLAGTGGSVTGVDVIKSTAGGALAVGGVAGAAIALRRRRVGGTD